MRTITEIYEPYMAYLYLSEMSKKKLAIMEYIVKKIVLLIINECMLVVISVYFALSTKNIRISL